MFTFYINEISDDVLLEFTTRFSLDLRAPKNLKHSIPITVRTKDSAGRLGKDAQHFCSIRIGGNADEFRILVPTVPYSKSEKHKKSITKDADKLAAKQRLNADTIDAIRAFIYDNQMAIIAYWFGDRSACEFLDDYLEKQCKKNDYLKNRKKYSEKTESQLTDDRNELKRLALTYPKVVSPLRFS